MTAKPNLSLYVPRNGDIERIDRRVKNLADYLKRVAKDYPEGTLAVYSTGSGTHQYRKHYRGSFELVRQTVGP